MSLFVGIVKKTKAGDNDGGIGSKMLLQEQGGTEATIWCDQDPPEVGAVVAVAYEERSPSNGAAPFMAPMKYALSWKVIPFSGLTPAQAYEAAATLVAAGIPCNDKVIADINQWARALAEDASPGK